MDPSQSPRNKFLILFQALAILVGACTFHADSQVDGVNVRVVTITAWNDFMPGSAPRGHVTMHATLENTGTKEIVLLPKHGVLRDANDHRELRKFQISITSLRNGEDTSPGSADEMQSGDVLREIRIPPSSTLACEIHERTGIEPVDTRVHPHIVFESILETPEHTLLLISSNPTEMIITQ